VSASEKTNYALKIKLMDDPSEFVNSLDPGELLEAGSTFNLSTIFYQVHLSLSLLFSQIVSGFRNLVARRAVTWGRAGGLLAIMVVEGMKEGRKRKIHWSLMTLMFLLVCSIGTACIASKEEDPR
jgi:hypothetical protein